jgi:hypothetical protein
VYLAFATVLWVAVSGRYEQAIVFAVDDSEANALTRLALLIAAASIAAVLLFVAMTTTWGLVLPANLQKSPAVWLLPLSLLGRTVSRIVLQRATRVGAFELLSASMVCQGTTQAALQLLLLVLGVDALICLAAADAVGHFAAACLVVRRDAQRFHVLQQRGASDALLAVARRWAQMPAWSMPTALLSVVAVSLPLLAFPLVASASVAGQITFAIQMLGIPSLLITSAATPVLQKSLQNATRRSFLLREGLLWLTLVTVVTFVGIAFLALLLAGPFASTRWSLSAAAVLWLIPYFIGITVSGPLIELVAAFRAERRAVAAHGAFLLVTLAVTGLVLYAGLDPFHGLLWFGLAAFLRVLLFARLLIIEASPKSSSSIY